MQGSNATVRVASATVARARFGLGHAGVRGGTTSSQCSQFQEGREGTTSATVEFDSSSQRVATTLEDEGNTAVEQGEFELEVWYS